MEADPGILLEKAPPRSRRDISVTTRPLKDLHTPIRISAIPQKGNAIYAIQLGSEDAGSSLTLKAFIPEQYTVKKVSMPGSSAKIEWTQDEEGLQIVVPEGGDKFAPVYKIKTKML